jgi:mannose-6-phosphate isomerase-like protein (cupin superfamily)
MKIIQRSDYQRTELPGRDIWKVVGKESYSESKKITFGFARFSHEQGQPEPHHHAEEICYVLKCKGAFVHFGPTSDTLGELHPLENEMTLHIPEMEWHQFVCEESGYLEIIFVYGQVDNIRPEEIESRTR